VDIAITGASGFIGSHMARYLMDKGHRVTGFANNTPRDPWRREVWDSLHQRRFVPLTHDDPFLHGFDRVYHFAADMGGVGYFSRNDFDPYINNSRMTFRVLKAVEFFKVERAFIASSACAYPVESQTRMGYAPRLYEALLETGEPDQMYGREKLMAIRLAERHKQDVRAGILHTIYGEGQEFLGDRVKFPMAASRKALQARSTGVVEMWGNGEQKRSYLHVDDAVRMIEAVTEGPYQGAVNIGYDGAVTCTEIQLLCLKLAGTGAEIRYNRSEPTGVWGRDCDSTKFRNLYGDMQTVNYSEGFGRLVNWLDGRL
jgi:GDP-D-mannose 3',5'-epimerase